MPSFSSLLKRSRKKREAEQPRPQTVEARDDTAREDVTRDDVTNVGNNRKDRASRRLSTRGDFFRSFLSRTRSSASPRPDADGDIQNKVCKAPAANLRPPSNIQCCIANGSSIANHNKGWQCSDSNIRSEQTIASSTSIRRLRIGQAACQSWNTAEANYPAAHTFRHT